jgi:hypothetical protein
LYSPRDLRLARVFLEHLDSWWKLNPGMPTAVVDGVFRGRKAWVGEGAYGDGYVAVLTLLSVEDICATDRAEPESVLRALISSADILGSSTNGFIG